MNYQKHYDLLILKHGSKAKPEDYAERHHIIPKCLGGSEDENNLVYLTAEAHYVAHQLLVKMNPEDPKLIYAAKRMTHGSKTTQRTNKLYGWLKKRFSIETKKQVHSEETLIKLRKPKSEEHKAKLRKPKSEEHRLKISAAMKGRKMSDEAKKKITIFMNTSHPRKGYKFTENEKKKMSDATKGHQAGNKNHFYGKKHSPETLEKIKEARARQTLKQRGVLA